jgi:hypothetical protein
MVRDGMRNIIFRVEEKKKKKKVQNKERFNISDAFEEIQLPRRSLGLENVSVRIIPRLI